MKTKEEIEQLAEQYLQKNKHNFDTWKEIEHTKISHINAYTQCQEDIVNRKYTEEDLRKAFKYGIEMEAGIESFDYKNYPDGFSQFINSLNKQD